MWVPLKYPFYFGIPSSYWGNPPDYGNHFLSWPAAATGEDAVGQLRNIAAGIAPGRFSRWNVDGILELDSG